MKLWRIDADYVNGDGEIAGMLTYFSLSPTFDQRSDVLIGWNRDAYEIDAGSLMREQVGILVGRPWPTLSLEDLVALAVGANSEPPCGDVDLRIELTDTASPALSDAKRQLNTALNHRDCVSGGSSSVAAGTPANQRLAWEGE